MSGRLAYRGTLVKGTRLQFRVRQVWLQLGAPANVTLRINGRPVAIRIPTLAGIIVSPHGLWSSPSGVGFLGS